MSGVGKATIEVDIDTSHMVKRLAFMAAVLSGDGEFLAVPRTALDDLRAIAADMQIKKLRQWVDDVEAANA